MRVRIRTEGQPISGESRGWIEETFRLSLGARLAPDVRTLRLDLSTPGEDASHRSARCQARCQVQVRLRDGEVVAFTEHSEELRKAVETAAWRLERRLRRLTDVARGRTLHSATMGRSGNR
jgi:ribosome-associated translation inhibitor RaiA